MRSHSGMRMISSSRSNSRRRFVADEGSSKAYQIGLRTHSRERSVNAVEIQGETMPSLSRQLDKDLTWGARVREYNANYGLECISDETKTVAKARKKL